MMLEKKKLKLKQPILSVRRHSPMEVNTTENGPRFHPSPPVKIAGAVPFHWEKTPGQPKHNFIQTEESYKSCSNSHGCDEKVEIAHRNNERKQEISDKVYLFPRRPRFCSLTRSVRLVNPVPAKKVGMSGCGSNRKSFQELLAVDQGSSKFDTLHELADKVRPAQENGFPGSIQSKEESEKGRATEKVLKQQLPRLISVGNSDINCSDSLVSPPLLKSPSDSWLWRTLLSASTKDVSRHCSNKVLKTIVL